MKRFHTDTDFLPLNTSVTEEGKLHFEPMTRANDKVITFKTRKAVEAFCERHDCMYAERKNIFYR